MSGRKQKVMSVIFVARKDLMDLVSLAEMSAVKNYLKNYGNYI